MTLGIELLFAANNKYIFDLKCEHVTRIAITLTNANCQNIDIKFYLNCPKLAPVQIVKTVLKLVVVVVGLPVICDAVISAA